jgi:hypothetical protein
MKSQDNCVGEEEKLKKRMWFMQMALPVICLKWLIKYKKLKKEIRNLYSLMKFRHISAASGSYGIIQLKLMPCNIKGPILK